MIVYLALAVVVLFATAIAARWSRLRRPARAGLVAGSVLSVVAASALQVNDLVQAYPEGGPSPAAASATTGSQLLTVTVPGRASGLTLKMYVYLPAAYRSGDHRYPVIEAAHGYPGSPYTWLHRLDAQAHLDQEIAAGRMAPTVVLFPVQTPRHLLDTECANLRGAPTETFLTVDVPAYARAHYRVRTDRAAWGLTGYSAGGFCTINLLLRHPGQYAAGASLSGYSSSGITIGDGSEKTTNNPGWRLRHLPQPAVSLWLGWARDDRLPARESRMLATLARPPLSVTTAVVAHGGHSDAVWTQMEPPAFDWLSAHLARPW